MIAVDTSALLGIVLGEDDAPALYSALKDANGVLISAGTLAEAVIVAERKRVRDLLDLLVEDIGPEVVAMTRESAERIGSIYRRWGKGFHEAKLNMGDCYAFELAESRALALLYKGEDFPKTDIPSVL